MAKQRLKVVYDGPEIDRGLDDALRKLLGEFGFKCWASGYNLVDDERDLAFERETEEVHHPVPA